MLSVNSNPTVTATVAKPQNTVAFRGKVQNLNHLSKKVLEGGVCARKHNGAISANKIIRWFKELKLRISGPTTKELIEISTPPNKESKAWMEFYEALAKEFLKK